MLTKPEQKPVNFFFFYSLFPVRLLLVLSLAAGFSAPARANPAKENRARTEQRKVFLLRSADEISWLLIFANEAVDVLTEQIQAAAGHEPEIKIDERAALLNWHQHYRDWLSSVSDDIQADLTGYFSGKGTKAWMIRSQKLDKESRKLGGELRGTIRRLEGERHSIEARTQKLRTAVEKRRLLVNKNNLKMARELWPGAYRKSYSPRKPFYRTLSDDNILYLRDVVRSLEDQHKYYDVLLELGEYEQDWLHIMSRDLSKLAAIARAMSRHDQSGILRASKSAVRTYNADIVALMKRLTELETNLEDTPSTGSIKTYERLQERSHYYEMLRSRYERRIEWYTGQIESYQMDFDAIGKEPKSLQ